MGPRRIRAIVEPGLGRVVRRLTATARPLAGGARIAARHLPLGWRVRLSKMFLRRPWKTQVRLDRVLLGSQAGLTAAEFADAIGDLRWASTPVTDGPHAQLFHLADERRHDELTVAEILSSPYGSMARRCINVRGQYFDAHDDAGIVRMARNAIAFHQGEGVDRSVAFGSRAAEPMLLAPIAGSSYLQVLDGHHRLASAGVRGEQTVLATVKWRAVTTPLQRHLARMSWIGGTKELYQPVPAPELAESWTLVRRCDDRLTKMRDVLRSEGITSKSGSTYLDVASCYGWFVARLGGEGFAAQGIERDPLAVPLGQAVYGLAPGAIVTGDCETFLANAPVRWDVVSCFSLLHHFVLGRGAISPEELLRRLDKVTGRVLFLDTGQEHERWFRSSLEGWDVEHVAKTLRAHTTFDRIVDLGPDDDARPPYHENYGRTLFAGIRDG